MGKLRDAIKQADEKGVGFLVNSAARLTANDLDVIEARLDHQEQTRKIELDALVARLDGYWHELELLKLAREPRAAGDRGDTYDIARKYLALFPPAPATLPRVTAVGDFIVGRDYKTPKGYMAFIDARNGRLYFTRADGADFWFKVYDPIYGPVPEIEVE